MNLNLGNEWQVIDDLETITYFQRSKAGLDAGTLVRNALARATDVSIPQFMGKAALRFHLWTNQLTGIVPKAEDQIQRADGTQWIVKKIQVCDNATRYVCDAVKTRP